MTPSEEEHGKLRSERWHSGLQDMAFYRLKGGLSGAKRPPFANQAETNENCKQKPLEYNRL